MIWNFCINRPVLTVVFFLVVGIFGLFGYIQMPVRENPDIDFPIVSVNVVYPGAEPEVIETEIIEPLEEEINTVEGLKRLTSESREQVGTVVAEFELWRDIDIATQDVRDRVNRALRDLPEEIEVPVVSKLDPDAQAVMWVALTGDRRWDEIRLTAYADEVLKPRLENIRGVGQIQIGGERRYAVRLILDPDKLAAHHLSVQEVVETVRANNVDIPTGRVESSEREFLVKTQGQFETPEPINDLIVAYSNEGPVRIRDIGTARAGIENDRQVARFHGRMSVGLGVVKQSDANTVALAESVGQRLSRFKENFPPGLTHTIAADDSEYIRASINDLILTVFVATVLVILVVFGFLHSAWGTLITSLSIPTSLLGGVAVMRLLGFSINTLSMLSLILAIGIVIDDTIVVLESTYRHMEEGADPVPAARIGTTEVAFAAIANTLSLCAVFIPVAFTSGLIGRFFFEFGLTVAATVIFSTLTALTLTAMLSSRLLRIRSGRGKVYRVFDRVFDQVEGAYSRILDKAFAYRGVTILAGAVALVLGVFLFTQLSTEFTPTVDRSQFMISFETPEGSTLRETDAYARRIEAVLSENAAVEHQFMAIGLSTSGGPGRVNEGIVFVRLIPREAREKHQREIVRDLRRKLEEVPNGRAFIIETSVGAGMAGDPVQLVLMHSDISSLSRLQDRIMSWMEAQPWFTGVRSDLEMNNPQARVFINREKAAQMGVSVADISNTLRYLLGRPDISEIERENERYEILTEVSTRGEMVPSALDGIYVKTGQGAIVPLGNLIRIEEAIGPARIPHFNRMRAATLSASLPPGVTLGDAIGNLTAYLEDNIPPAFEYTFTGQTQDFQESFRNLTLALMLSIVFIYLVLAAQFESFLHPFTILFTLPLATVGAFGALWILDMPFGIVAFIGLIMLMGMATKNGILLIDYINILIARGGGVADSAKQAARVRFRPVVMTTLSTVLGILPIALGFGAGGEARSPMGVAVSAGLVATTVLTLLVLPVVYTLLNGLIDYLRRKEL